MLVVFADDARQSKPSRLGTGSLVAIGGVFIPADHVGPLERFIEQLCRKHSFPAHEQFKWSPRRGREDYMRQHLIDSKRLAFYRDLLALAEQFGVTTSVVVEDTQYRPAREDSANHEADAVALFLERVSSTLSATYTDGIVVVARPSGGPRDDEEFLAACLGLIETGTEYQTFLNLPVGVFTAHSRRIRLLQLADIVTSCTVARIAGEPRYSPEVFELLKPLYRRAGDRVGGIGVKLHPDLVYANLYHWLFDDAYIFRDRERRPLPDTSLPFADHPNEAVVTSSLIRSGKRKGK